MKTTTLIRGHLSLTPALSRWERENYFQRLGKTASDFCLMTFGFYRHGQRLFPLPAGEGKGEGERREQLELISNNQKPL